MAQATAFTPGVPPWDAPCWLTLDLPALLENVPASGAMEWAVDLRSPILARAWRHIAPELKRRAAWGYASRGFRLTGGDAVSEEGWIRVLAPPASAGAIAEAVRNGFTVTIGQTSEAIVASNAAQAYGRRSPILIRVRTGELMADPGSTGCVSMLEAIPGLAALDVAGFWLDDPFTNRQECDQFMRAVGRLLGDVRSLLLVGAGTGPVPPRMKPVALVGRELFGYSRKPLSPAIVTATLTLEAWAYPFRTRGRNMLVGIDIGSLHGISREARPPVIVGSEIGRVIAVEERRIVVELAQRPASGGPWRALLMGSHDTQTVSVEEWPDHAGLLSALEHLGRDYPLFVRQGAEMTGTESLPSGV